MLFRSRPIDRSQQDILGALAHLLPRLAAELNTLFQAQSQCDYPAITLARNGLQGYEFQPCFLLSAGQQQRAALARLLIAEELMWVLDEPFNALDTQAVDMLEVVMGDHAKKGGIVLVTTHHRLKIPGLRTVDLS